MNEIGQGALLLSLFLAGLAGSLHCIGMCGPILASFFELFRDADGARPRGGRGLALDFAAYHGGRIWTYAVLGFIAGLAGKGLREGGASFGWQRPAAIVIAAAVILAGLLLLGLIPGRRFETLINGCGIARIRNWPWFRGLLNGPGLFSRFLLGAVMGLLPCGLVYGMLVMVAAMPTPVHAAAGMLVFGVGTIPSLSAVLLASWSVSGWLRRHGTTIVAATLILTGCVMLARAVLVPRDACHSHGPKVTRSLNS